jgi:phage shock protein A
LRNIVERARSRATDAQLAVDGRSSTRTFDRMKEKITSSEAVSQAKASLVVIDVDERFATLERDEEVDRLLAELKAKRA